jgi:hypothetical protein
MAFRINWHNVFHPSDKALAGARLRRRAVPIHAYLGAGNGSGKTLAMIHDTIPSLEAGRPVLSTVRILDYKNPRPCDDPTCTWPGHPDHQAAHPLFIPFRSYDQLLAARDCDVLMDEIVGIASSRDYNSMPVQVANFLTQLRRRNIALRWTATNWARADVIIREVTNAVTLSVPVYKIRRVSPPGEPISLWRDGVLFMWKTFDAALIDDFDARGANNANFGIRNYQLYFRPGAYAMGAYDTLDSVSSVGWANLAGMCMVCGGKRTIPRCSCPDHGSIHPREAVDSRRGRAIAQQSDPAHHSSPLISDSSLLEPSFLLDPVPGVNLNLADLPDLPDDNSSL